MIDGLSMNLVGMSTLFCALAALVGMITLTTRIFGRPRLEASAATKVAPAALSDARAREAKSEAPEESLLQVAMAAYAYHRGRQTITAPLVQSSSWSSARRMQQIAAFRR